MPLWVTAAACAATKTLRGSSFEAQQSLVVPEEDMSINVPVTSAALLAHGDRAMAISHCESGAVLDLTRGLEIWVYVQWLEPIHSSEKDLRTDSKAWLKIDAGMGVGTYGAGGAICISAFARELLEENLRPLVAKDKQLKLEVVFPRGKELAERTSNSAFGVVDGLALLGTQAEVQRSASPEQLEKTLHELRRLCRSPAFRGTLALVIGANGFDLAHNLGLDACPLIKTGNWLGPLMVAAAEERVGRLLVFGYHGKLVKLAGGIFHTHHHLADGRLEILTALAVQEGLPLQFINALMEFDTIESALIFLEGRDFELARRLWKRLVLRVEERSAAYIQRYGTWTMLIGAAAFDRKRRLRWAGPNGVKLLDQFGLKLYGSS